MDKRAHCVYFHLDPERVKKLLQAKKDGANKLVILTMFINSIVYVGKGNKNRCFDHETFVFTNVSITICF